MPPTVPYLGHLGTHTVLVHAGAGELASARAKAVAVLGLAGWSADQADRVLVHQATADQADRFAQARGQETGSGRRLQAVARLLRNGTGPVQEALDL